MPINILTNFGKYPTKPAQFNNNVCGYLSPTGVPIMRASKRVNSAAEPPTFWTKNPNNLVKCCKYHGKPHPPVSSESDQTTPFKKSQHTQNE